MTGMPAVFGREISSMVRGNVASPTASNWNAASAVGSVSVRTVIV
jgi:hypothetical protein